MRSLLLLVSMTAALSTGCSVFIAASGKDMGKFRDREQVREQFGNPVEVGTDDGKSFDEYRTRRKIAEPQRAGFQGMGVIMTYGVLEVVALPHELYLLGRRTLLGQSLRISYDADGRVLAIKVDGREVLSYPQSEDRDVATQPAIPGGQP